MMLTVFLKHQKDKNLAEINAKLDATGFWKRFHTYALNSGALSGNMR